MMGAGRKVERWEGVLAGGRRAGVLGGTHEARVVIGEGKPRAERTNDGYLSQLASLSSGTRENSRVLAVTRGTPRAKAWPAIRVS